MEANKSIQENENCIETDSLRPVNKAVAEFRVIEDRALAHHLQNREIEHHLALNVEQRRTAINDLKTAKEWQDEEDRRAQSLALDEEEELRDLDKRFAEILQEELYQHHVKEEEEKKTPEEKDNKTALRMNSLEERYDERRSEHDGRLFEEMCHVRVSLGDRERRHELSDEELARRLQEQEEMHLRRKGKNKDHMKTVIEMQDAELARFIHERELEEAEWLGRRAREKQMKRTEKLFQSDTPHHSHLGTHAYSSSSQQKYGKEKSKKKNLLKSPELQITNSKPTPIPVLSAANPIAQHGFAVPVNSPQHLKNKDFHKHHRALEDSRDHRSHCNHRNYHDHSDPGHRRDQHEYRVPHDHREHYHVDPHDHREHYHRDPHDQRHCRDHRKTCDYKDARYRLSQKDDYAAVRNHEHIETTNQLPGNRKASKSHPNSTDSQNFPLHPDSSMDDRITSSGESLTKNCESAASHKAGDVAIPHESRIPTGSNKKLANSGKGDGRLADNGDNKKRDDGKRKNSDCKQQ